MEREGSPPYTGGESPRYDPYDYLRRDGGPARYHHTEEEEEEEAAEAMIRDGTEEILERTPIQVALPIERIDRFNQPHREFWFTLLWVRGEPSPDAVDARKLLITRHCHIVARSASDALYTIAKALDAWLRATRRKGGTGSGTAELSYANWSQVHSAGFRLRHKIVAHSAETACHYIEDEMTTVPTLDLRQLRQGRLFLSSARVPSTASLRVWIEAVEEQLQMTREQFAGHALNPELVRLPHQMVTREKALFLDQAWIKEREAFEPHLAARFGHSLHLIQQQLTLPQWRHLYRGVARIGVRGGVTPETEKLPALFSLHRWSLDQLVLEFTPAANAQRTRIARACQLLDIAQFEWLDALALDTQYDEAVRYAHNVMGFSYGPALRIFALNPMLAPREYLWTCLHEMAHILLGHLEPGAHAQPEEEFEVECVTVLCMHALSRHQPELVDEAVVQNTLHEQVYAFLYSVNGDRALTVEECARLRLREDDLRGCASLLINALLDRVFVTIS